MNDIKLIDSDSLGLAAAQITHDLPAGVVIMEHGEPRATMPVRLVRAGAQV